MTHRKVSKQANSSVCTLQHVRATAGNYSSQNDLTTWSISSREQHSCEVDVSTPAAPLTYARTIDPINHKIIIANDNLTHSVPVATGHPSLQQTHATAPT